MVWARFSDDWPDQPAVIALSDSAFRAYAESVFYVARFTTDGHVPVEALKPRARRAAPELIRAGLWTADGSGWYAPCWAEHVPPAAELAKARAADAERKRRHRGGTP